MSLSGEARTSSLANPAQSEKAVVLEGLIALRDKALAINPDMAVEVVKLLANVKENANATDKYKRTVLHYATWFGQNVLADHLLVERNINVDLQDEDGKTPLHFAAKFPDTHIATALLQRPIQFLKDKNGRTPLHDAVIEKNLQVVKELLKNEECKKQINELDNFGKTALHYAAESGQDKIVAELLTVDQLEVNLPNREKYTAFGLAGYYSFGSVAGELIKCAKLEINVKDDNDYKAIECAKKNGHQENVDSFLKKYINKYKEKRNSEEGDYQHWWGSFFGGASKQQKVDAADYVIKHFSEKKKMEELSEFKTHEKALKGGSELGNAYKLSL